MASLAEIRAKLKEQESRSSGNSNSGGDTQFTHFGILKKVKVVLSDSFLMVTKITLFSGQNV